MAWSGGRFVSCLSLAKCSVSKGHRVTLATTSQTSRWTRSQSNVGGVDIIEYPALFPGRVRSGWDPVDTLARTISVIRREFGHLDIVHAFDSRPTVILPALLLAKTASTPLIMDWADWWGRGGTIEARDTTRFTRVAVRRVETWFEESFRHRAARTTVISTGLANRAR